MLTQKQLMMKPKEKSNSVKNSMNELNMMRKELGLPPIHDSSEYNTDNRNREIESRLNEMMQVIEKQGDMLLIGQDKIRGTIQTFADKASLEREKALKKTMNKLNKLQEKGIGAFGNCTSNFQLTKCLNELIMFLIGIVNFAFMFYYTLSTTSTKIAYNIPYIGFFVSIVVFLGFLFIGSSMVSVATIGMVDGDLVIKEFTTIIYYILRFITFEIYENSNVLKERIAGILPNKMIEDYGEVKNYSFDTVNDIYNTLTNPIGLIGTSFKNSANSIASWFYQSGGVIIDDIGDFEDGSIKNNVDDKLYNTINNMVKIMATLMNISLHEIMNELKNPSNKKINDKYMFNDFLFQRINQAVIKSGGAKKSRKTFKKRRGVTNHKRKGKTKNKRRMRNKHKRKGKTKSKRKGKTKSKRKGKTKSKYGRGFFGKSKNPRKNPDDFEEAFKKALKKHNKINLKNSINVIKSRTPTIDKNIKRELSWLLGGNK